MSILLIRHGETALNAARVVQPPDTPLSPRGVAQAEALGERLRDFDVRRVVTSDLTRAEMTAERICAASGAPLDVDAGLQERNFGALRGTPYAELDVDLFGADYAPPGGETWPVFDGRVDAVWRRVAARAGGLVGHLAVVTHGLVCRSLVSRHLRVPESLQPAPDRWANTSLTVVAAEAPWTVELLNCTAHLNGNLADDARAPSGL